MPPDKLWTWRFLDANAAALSSRTGSGYGVRPSAAGNALASPAAAS